jgi:hypothetical protein
LPTLLMLIDERGGRLLLGLAPEEQRADIAHWLAAAAGNVIHLHARAQRSNATIEMLEHLIRFSQAFPELISPTIAQASTAPVVASLIRDGTRGGARELLARTGSEWETRGRDRWQLEIIVRSLGLQISAAAQAGDLFTAQLLFAEAADFVERLKAGPEMPGWLAESGSTLIGAAVDADAFQIADKAFADVLRLSAVDDAGRLAKSRGIAALRLLQSYSRREDAETDEWFDRADDLLAVTRATVWSDAFEEGLRADGSEGLLRESRRVVLRLEQGSANDEDAPSD